MNSRSLVLALTVLLITAAPLFAGDLYLLGINSYDELNRAENIIPVAHGRIDGKFIVELNDTQVGQLNNEGFNLEKVSSNVNLDNLYLVNQVHDRAVKSGYLQEPVYSDGVSNLVELMESDLDYLRRNGYMTIPVDIIQTPLFYNPPQITAPFRVDYPSDSLADLVIQDSLYSYNTRFEAFQTRHIFTDSIDAAMNWVKSKLEEFGYSNVKIDTFYYNSTVCHNVYVIKEGSEEPQQLIVIGGHYDSINFDSDYTVYAPGADDNGSGSSTVLELARIYANVDNKKSMMFTVFSAEEVGLYGSNYMAWRLTNGDLGSYNIECMLNWDMVAYNGSGFNEVAFFYADSRVYADALYAATERVTYLSPYYAGTSASSDHASFAAYGHLVAYTQEGEFNYDGWHTDLDINSRLDFNYFEQILRLSAATLGHIDNAAHLTPVEYVIDVGDGQSLRVVWGDYDPTYTYQVLYGTTSGNYTDTVDAIPGQYWLDVGGLTEGQEYYFTVLGINSLGYGPISLVEQSGIPLLEPRQVTSVTASPALSRVALDWQPNGELDLDHYRIKRRIFGETEWQVIEDNIIDSEYNDFVVAAHTRYEYQVFAVDNDGYTSDTASIVSAIPATFDLPLLFVDETGETGSLNPSEEEQAAVYDSVLLFGTDYDKFYIDNGPQKLDRSEAGQYENLIWVDDDLSGQLLSSSIDSLEWYLNNTTNICIAGWQTLTWYAGEQPLNPGNFLYDYFGITQLTENINFDFVGATGDNGWPNITNRTDNMFNGVFLSIPKLDHLPGAQVIYRFDSQSDDPQFEGEPCGVIYNRGDGLGIALSFPLYYLTESSARALMTKLYDTFGIEIETLSGDVNGDGSGNLLDITYLINYLYKSGPAPVIMNNGDVNGDCAINLLDVTYFINYLYKAGPGLQPGCVE